ncbi:MAG TPA: hypothetical protein VJB37_02740 [Patescibacteria group bacterium]|nr:hypothetical protein [Patescibacteria group bacterium]
MPVKKNKKNKRKKTDLPSPKDIKRAVETIPGLIVEQQWSKAETFERPTLASENEKPTTRPLIETQASRQKRQMLWISLIAFAIAVLGLWGYNLYFLAQNIPHPLATQKQPQEIWKEIKQDFSQAMKDTNTPIETSSGTLTPADLSAPNLNSMVSQGIKDILKKQNTTTSISETTNQ